MPEQRCTCDGEDSDGRGDVLRCPVHGLGVAQPERHSEAYDPGPRRRIGGQYFDVDDVPPRGDRDY